MIPKSQKKQKYTSNPINTVPEKRGCLDFYSAKKTEVACNLSEDGYLISEGIDEHARRLVEEFVEVFHKNKEITLQVKTVEFRNNTINKNWFKNFSLRKL